VQKKYVDCSNATVVFKIKFRMICWHLHWKTRTLRIVFSDNMAAVVSSIMPLSWNTNAHNQTYREPILQSFIEIGPLVSPCQCGQTDRQTHTHTDTHRHTHRQTTRYFWTRTIPINVNEMTECKKAKNYSRTKTVIVTVW